MEGFNKLKPILWISAFAGMIVLFVDIYLQSYFRSVGVGVGNGGISFGLLPSISWGIILVFYVFLLAWFIKEVCAGKSNFGIFCIVLGGMGNLLPRLVSGNVWDYVSLPWIPFWFNLSDVLISVGVVSYILMADGNSSTVRRFGYSGDK